MLGFLKTEFVIVVADEDMTEENLGTLNAIAGVCGRAAGRAERSSSKLSHALSLIPVLPLPPSVPRQVR
ncbi:MAG TPA: hypothetical protein VLT79_01175, partial [Gemmatimonadales bacterium]|nr:hypothetical protein [Gemmatimonadales bacterium]